jgi:hypothetical protein
LTRQKVEKRLIGVFSPRSDVRDLIASRTDVLILDSIGLYDWYLGEISIAEVDYLSLASEFQFVLDALQEFGPIFTRHYDDLPNMELHKRDIGIYILKIATALSASGIKFVIFPTGVSHHLVTVIGEIACRVAKVTQIFTYTTSISERLVILEQLDSIYDRHALETKFGEFSRKYLEVHHPLQAPPTSAPHERPIFSYPLAVCRILRLFLGLRKVSVRNSLKNSFKKHRVRQASIGELQRYSLRREVRLMWQQRASLELLDCFIQEDEKKLFEFLNEKAHPRFCLFAHQQPEATSCPEGGRFTNHIDLILYIRSLGYSAPIIYKEHPASYIYSTYGTSTRVGIGRSPQYFKILRELGCIFVNQTFSPELSFNIWPITLSGSIALERGFQGLSTVVMGEPWYKGLPGTHSIEQILKSNSSCPQAPDQLLRNDVAGYIWSFFDQKSISNNLIIKNQKSLSGRSFDLFAREYLSLIDSLISRCD